MWESNRGLNPPKSWMVDKHRGDGITKENVYWLSRVANKIETKMVEATKMIYEILEGYSIDFNVKDGAITDWSELVENFKKVADIIDIEKVLKEELAKAKPNIKRTVNNIEKIATEEIRNYQNKIIKKALMEVNKKEIENIKEDMDSRIISNFTDTEIPKELLNLLKNGRKFTPRILINNKQAIDLFKEDMANVLNGILSNYGKKLFHKNSLIKDIVQKLILVKNNEEQKLLEEVLNEIETLDKAKGSEIIAFENGPINLKIIKKIFKEYIEMENKILIESDKGLGFTLLSMEQITTLFQKINHEQGFILVNMTNEQYLKWISQMKKEYCNTIPIEIKELIEEKDIDEFNNITGHMSILRLLAKSGKIKEPNKNNFDQLTARTIKTGTSDPINRISNIIRIIANKLLIRMRNKMDGNINTIVGTDDAVEKVKKIGIQKSLMEAVNVQGDVTEMYPNCTFTTVRLSFIRLGNILNIKPRVITFLIGAVRVIMTCNIVLQPQGVYQMGKGNPEKMGLSIGDKCAAEVSDLTMIISEFDLATTLKQEKLLMKLIYYVRFRDDLDIKIAGTQEEILKIIFIIMAHLPRCFEIKGKLTFFLSNFLDIKRIAELGSGEKYMLLRKQKNPYDITRSTSNVEPNAKRAAMMCYAYRSTRKTNSQIDTIHQFKANMIILKKRGYKEEEFVKVMEQVKYRENKKKNDNNLKKEKDNRKFLPGIRWDEVSGNHLRILKVLRRSKILRRYRTPALKPMKKILGMVFTKKSSTNQMEKYLGRPATSFKLPIRPMYLKFINQKDRLL